jgi:hypothetical protein
VGCILAELLYRKPLFPGKDYIDQLKLIIRMLGSPTDADLEFISSAKARAYIKALPAAQVRCCPPCPACPVHAAHLLRRHCPSKVAWRLQATHLMSSQPCCMPWLEPGSALEIRHSLV